MSMFECSYSYFHVKSKKKKGKKKKRKKKRRWKEEKGNMSIIFIHTISFFFFNQKECTSENTTRHNLGECQTFPRARTDWYPVKKKDF